MKFLIQVWAGQTAENLGPDAEVGSWQNTRIAENCTNYNDAFDLAREVEKKRKVRVLQVLQDNDYLSTDVIPKGVYCYDKNGVCPYWDKNLDKPEQHNGYCHYLKSGDWMDEDIGGWGLLWDQCKECGINKDDEEAEAAWGQQQKIFDLEQQVKDLKNASNS
jgi:hypothetical protein